MMPSEKWDAFGALSRLAVTFQMAPDGAHRRIWNELAPWFRTLATRAGPKWLPRMSMSFPCHIVAVIPGEPTPKHCPHSAVASCLVCKRPTCLAHSFVNVEGETICYSCASEAAGLKGNGAPPPEDAEARKEALRRAREVLEVGPRASWKTIHRAYRRKAAQAHPDSGGSEVRFREIQEAYEILKAEHEAEQS
jgi:hypothetical protein